MFVDAVNRFGWLAEVCEKYRTNCEALSCPTNEPDAGGDGKSSRIKDRSGCTGFGRV
jgi:hypothetical protein